MFELRASTYEPSPGRFFFVFMFFRVLYLCFYGNLGLNIFCKTSKHNSLYCIICDHKKHHMKQIRWFWLRQKKEGERERSGEIGAGNWRWSESHKLSPKAVDKQLTQWARKKDADRASLRRFRPETFPIGYPSELKPVSIFAHLFFAAWLFGWKESCCLQHLFDI